MKNKKLEEAIKVIEEAGGFVMMQSINKEEYAEMTDGRIEELEEEERKRFEEYQSRKKDAFNDFQKMLKRKDFSISGVEDMIHYHGLDMDDLEEMIHKYY